MSGFDRIKPVDQRLLQRREGDRLAGEDADPEGRAALFSAGSPGAGHDRAGERRGLGAVAVHCSRCDVTTALDVGTALRAVIPLFVVAPWRDHPVFAVCPACGVRSWLAPRTG